MASRGRSNYAAHVKKYRRPETEETENENGNYQTNLESHKYNVPKYENDEEEEAQTTLKRFSEIEERNSQDEQFGFIHYSAGPSKTGWILNMKSVNFLKKHLYSSN